MMLSVCVSPMPNSIEALKIRTRTIQQVDDSMCEAHATAICYCTVVETVLSRLVSKLLVTATTAGFHTSPVIKNFFSHPLP